MGLFGSFSTRAFNFLTSTVIAYLQAMNGPLSIVLFVLPVIFISTGYTIVKELAHSPQDVWPEKQFCPYETPEEWQKFLEYYSDYEKWTDTCEDSSCDEESYQFVKDNIQRTLERCSASIQNNRKIAQCTNNLRRFVPFWLKQHDGDSYGFLADNHAYLAAQSGPENPPQMMEVPPPIIAALPDRKKVEEAARINGFQYLTHDSAIDGFRTFIFIPDKLGRFDQWMLLNLSAKNATVLNKTQFSIITVQKKTANGGTLPKVRLHFRDYTIVKGQKQYSLELNESGNGKCFSCHSNGMRQLIPRKTPILEALPVKGEPLFDSSKDLIGKTSQRSTASRSSLPSIASNNVEDFAFQRLMQFNRKLRAYGAPDWNGMVQLENNGPHLGVQQNCTACHNGVSRGALTVFTSKAQIQQKMYKELSMPPNNQLPILLEQKQMSSPAFSKEKEEILKEAYGMHAALLKDFEDSRLPALKEWLLEVSCK